jgi:glycosyltransferase 2 family protein
MNQNVKKVLIYTLFFALGIAIFWGIYRNIKPEELKVVLGNLNYWWILSCVLFGISSHLIRAIRWNMLIRSIGYEVRLSNSFLAVLVLYFTNLIIPRAGELSRCTILAKYEKIPISKLIGTVIMERITDVLVTIIIAIVIFTINISVLNRFLDMHPQLKTNFLKMLSINNLLVGILIIGLVILTVIYFKPFKNSKIGEKIKRIKQNLIEGISSITKLKNRWLYIFYSFLIFFLYLIMLYVVFLAFGPTSHLSIWTATFVFLMGTLAMLAPVQGGIGPWHFMVYETLFIYGIDKTDGKLFALIAHTSTSLIYIIIGLVAVILLPILNRTKVVKASSQN